LKPLAIPLSSKKISESALDHRIARTIFERQHKFENFLPLRV